MKKNVYSDGSPKYEKNGKPIPPKPQYIGEDKIPEEEKIINMLLKFLRSIPLKQRENIDSLILSLSLIITSWFIIAILNKYVFKLDYYVYMNYLFGFLNLPICLLLVIFVVTIIRRGEGYVWYITKTLFTKQLKYLVIGNMLLIVLLLTTINIITIYIIIFSLLIYLFTLDILLIDTNEFLKEMYPEVWKKPNNSPESEPPKYEPN